MPDTRSSLIMKYDDLPKEEKKMDNPKSLLENYVQLNETEAPSQPDDSPTVTHIIQRANRRSSRRSSGIRALTQTPRVLLKNFVENAPEETTVQVSSFAASVESDAYLSPIPQKISKVTDDDQNDSSVYEEEIVRKMPRIRYKAVLEKFSVGLKQLSESPDEDSGSEIKRKPERIKKIRNKITADDIASGIKLSQEMAAETERSYNVTEATKTDASLYYPSMNTLNAEKLDNTTLAVGKISPEKTDLPDTCEEKEDSHCSKPEKYSKRKRSIIKEDSSKVEETVQKAKMLRLKTNANKLVSIEDARSSEVETTELPKLVSEAELTEVAYTVEVAESMEVTENVQDVGSEERSESHEIEEKIIVKKITNNVRQETEETENSELSFTEINKLLQDESISTEKTTNNKESEKPNKAILYIGDIKRTNSSSIAVEDSSEQADLKSYQSVSKTSEELPSSPGINSDTIEDSKDAQSKMIKSTLEDVEALAKSSRGDNSDVPKGSGSKESLAENVDSSYLEASSRTFELKENTAKEHPLLDFKVRETLASGESQTSDVGLEIPEIAQINLGALSVGKVNSSIISHESSVIASQTSEMYVQSNEIEEKEQKSIESPILIEEKEKHKELGSLVAGNVSTDEHEELFPSSPKETTSSGHSRSSSPASSEADKATQCLTLPSSKSAFVEMKSPRSNVLPSSSGVLTKRISSIKKSSIKRKSLEQLENKSYRMIDSVASITESLPNIENLHVTKDVQILSQSPFHTTISTQQTTERPVAPEPQGGTSQNEKSASQGSRKHKFKNRLKKYTIPPNVTSLLMNHYSGLKIPTACLPELGKISDQFFDNLFEALNSYVKHASHKKIEDSDVELYFKRVGLVNKDKSIKTLIREYLPLEDQQLLIPVARSGNIVTGGFSNKEK